MSVWKQQNKSCMMLLRFRPTVFEGTMQPQRGPTRSSYQPCKKGQSDLYATADYESQKAGLMYQTAD